MSIGEKVTKMFLSQKSSSILDCRMGAGRKTTFPFNDTVPSSPEWASKFGMSRNLGKSNLGGVIFGCKHSTIKECLSKQLFGLPAHHFLYVKNISPGLPLFLFNYSDRKLHGIFDAASPGQMNINPYAWASDGSERTGYPAQVQVHIKLQCQPLSEEQFKPLILDNYYGPNHFYFELDHAQASRLISKLRASAAAPSAVSPQNSALWEVAYRPSTFKDRKDEAVGTLVLPRNLQSNSNHFANPIERSGTSDSSLSSDDQHSPLDPFSDNDVVYKDAKDLMYKQLKELALNRDSLDASMTRHHDEIPTIRDHSLTLQSSQAGEALSEEKKGNTGGIDFESSDHSTIIAQLLQDIEELKAFKEEQTQKADRMERKLLEAEEEIRRLNSRYLLLDSFPAPAEDVDATRETPLDFHLDLDESIFLVGGYDGFSFLASLDLYSPSQDILKSLKPMNSARSYSSVVKLHRELYVFGGGDGHSWYNTVESYNAASNEWSSHPSLKEEKGSLAGVSLNNKIFAIGGGNGRECFSSVEMYDLYVGKWIPTQSMLQKRFALAAAELNGALYACGGYDGESYLKSAERFDPREHSWSKIDSMNMQRGCHSMVVMNEKLYVLGGYDGSEMSASIEIYDPRVGKWMGGEPMNESRGYISAALLNDSIYVMGGLRSDEDVVDTIEWYKEGEGWKISNKRGPGRRCFCPAIVLGAAGIGSD